MRLSDAMKLTEEEMSAREMFRSRSKTALKPTPGAPETAAHGPVAVMVRK